MSKKNPTVAQLMEAEGYHEGDRLDPRVGRFLSKQERAKWRRIQSLLRKKARRKAQRSGRQQKPAN